VQFSSEVPPVRSNFQLFLSEKVSKVLEGRIMSSVFNLTRRYLKKELLYIENGKPVLYQDIQDTARLATLGDMSIIVPAWSSLVGRIIEGRE